MSVASEEEADRVEGVRHPRRATQLFGQPDHERALLDAFRAGRLPHAIILAGQMGIGKATLAWRLTKFLLANSSVTHVSKDAVDLATHAACGTSSQVESLSHPDVVLLRREVNEKTKRFFTEIRADDVRRATGLFQRAAGAGGYRICIVDSADDLNRFSANALLKMIEEPPPSSLFILIAHRPGLLLPTIRSRSRLIRLHPLKPDMIARTVASLGPPWSEMEEGEIRSAAEQANGSVRDALKLLSHRGTDLTAIVTSLLERLPALEWREIHRLADKISGREGEAAYETALTTIFEWLRARVEHSTGSALRRLAPLAEVWEKIAQSAHETEDLNLDKRPLILSIFSDLAAAVRASSA